MSQNRADRRQVPPVRPDAGLAIAEVMISMVILVTSLLVIAATSARVGETVNGAHIRSNALAVAQREVESLVVRPYDEVASGASQADGVQLEWTVDEGDQIKEIVMVYRYTLPGAVREDTITAAVRR